MTLFAAIIGAGGAIAGYASSGGGMRIELWQAINLVGAPLLAMLFARPVADDLVAWFRSRPR